ncbi:MAG: heme-binding beta-barrel domain-containing protein [Paracoccus sp. (in: a-proteobacteria)]|nr:heme-binding beta-barrel domain-containing protein [Paracoccus sp. (in: a-proteobacteria)]
MRLHRDIFTEPSDVDPDTLANLGPLRPLAGVWQADKGIDVNPKADGPQTKPFIEHIRMDPIDPQTNGPQLFYGMRYHIHINTPGEAITFHDQTGYWLWEPATGLILQTLAIPRGQSLLAAGRADADARSFSVSARRGDPTYGITSTEFLDRNFRTESYRIEITCHDDDSWSYLTATELIVEGKPFDHHDSNRLRRTGAPAPNPLLLARKPVS